MSDIYDRVEKLITDFEDDYRAVVTALLHGALRVIERHSPTLADEIAAYDRMRCALLNLAKGSDGEEE